MPQFDIQGHRGARGNYPENTIPAFIYALQAGVSTLEMDVAVSADGQLVVSHEPWMSAAICSHPDGRPVAKEEEMSLNIYRMNYDSIAKFDCGIRGNERFPGQRKMAVSKPLLTAVFDTIEKIIKEKKLPPVHYNIETKCSPEGDNLYHPAPLEFVKLLADEVNKHELEERVILQSFDIRTLQEMKRVMPRLRLALLEGTDSRTSRLDSLGFVPDIYSPDYHLVNPSLVEKCHAKGIRVIPWTVNEPEELKNLMTMKVDGIITDYPDRAIQLISKQ